MSRTLWRTDRAPIVAPQPPYNRYLQCKNKNMRLPGKLWKPQKESCNLIEGYINDFYAGKTKASFLVKMPTGTGKTGVMTVVSHEITKVRSILVVCPRTALRTQLFNEISNDFYSKIGYASKNLKKVIQLKSGNNFVASHLSKIVVTTIQKLNSTRRNESKTFDKICKKFELIIFDEGHYEPATNWSRSIREIDSPKIIFTATPFRNDFKTFEFHSDYVYAIKHSECEKLNILRKPKFIALKNESNPTKFVKQVLIEFKKVTTQFSNARLIIRCDDYPTILKISKALEVSGEDFVSIHERFKPKKYSWGFKNVPPTSIKSNIWVHQYKLLEGIDDPNFMVLSSFKPIKNSRQLIQQIGRILRNVKRIKKQKAIVLDDKNSVHQKTWDSYLKYDENINDQVGKTYGENLMDALNQLPEIEYVDRAFRKNYLKEPLYDLLEDIYVPLSTNVLRWDIAVDSKMIEKKINFYHDDKDFSSTFHRIDSNSGVHLYITYESSPILANHFFFDINLNICIHKIIKGKVLFYDSKGTSLSTLVPDNGLRSVNPKSLKKLISGKLNSRVVNISLKNSVLGNNAITGHSYSAISVKNTTPYLDDHGQVISSVVGYSKETKSKLFDKKDIFRRYIGMQKGRITQTNSRHNLDIYFKWLEEIVTILDDSSKSNSVFKRFATETKPPPTLKPLNILLDFSEIKAIKFQDGSGEIESHEIISKVNEIGGKFITNIKLGNDKYEIELFYNPLKRLFTLSSDEISKTFWNEKDEDIIKYFNQNQSFRIVTDLKNVMYAFGSFFNPQLKTGRSFKQDDFQLRNVLVPIDQLGNKFINEKGKQCQPGNVGWQKDSLFHLVDSKGKGTKLASEFKDADILICDDMGTEVADFILSTKSKVMFIHVKGIGKKPVSKVAASKLMDVCSQAIKNLEYLSMFNTDPPAGMNSKWKKSWKANKVKGEVDERIRIGNRTNIKENWKTISNRIADPSTEKEVCLLLGGILSKEEFITQLKKEKGNSVAIQALMLLNGTLANVGSIGAKLKVYCSK